MFRTGEEAAEFLMHRQGHHCGYPHFQQVMEELGNPQDAFKAIHIAGTNGKGSTSNYIADILMALGYKVGLYTSPYLVHHFDRIRINGAWIDEESFLHYANELLPYVEKYNLSMFETDTIIASMYFRDQKVDFAVMEAGVGGLRDATNTMHHPQLSIITTVGMDHMSSLGNTIPEIASQKAGIIKSNGKALAGYLLPEAMEVVEKVAAEKQAELCKAGEFIISGERSFVLDGVEYTIASSAEYQKRNASTALHAVRILGEDISRPEVIEAVQKSAWAGRFETVRENPLVILDGAHNTEGIQALIDSFVNLPHPVNVVFSALRDKQGKTMCGMLRTASDKLYVTEFSMYRADTADALSEISDEIVYDWQEALKLAMQQAENGGCVVVSGSLYFISLVREYFLQNAG